MPHICRHCCAYLYHLTNSYDNPVGDAIGAQATGPVAAGIGYWPFSGRLTLADGSCHVEEAWESMATPVGII